MNADIKQCSLNVVFWKCSFNSAYTPLWEEGEMAKLTSTWWAKTKPANFKEKNLDTALKGFEAAVRNGNSGVVLDAIFNVRNEIPFTRNALKKALKANPVKFKVLQIELNELEKLLDREDKLVLMNGAKQIKVWSRSFSGEVTKQCQKKIPLQNYLKFTGGTTEVRLDLMTIHAVENSGAEARFLREVNDTFDAEVEEFVQYVVERVSNASGLGLSQNALKLLNMKANDQAKSIEKKLVKLAIKTADNAAMYHDAAKFFKKKRAVDVTTATLGVAGGVAGIFVPGTNAVAAVVLIRSSAKLIEEVVTLLTRLEIKYDSVMAQITILQKAFASGQKNRDRKEVAKTTVNAVLGADVMVTHAAVVKRYEDFLGALAVLADKVNKAQGKILAAIAKLGDLDKALAKTVADQAAFAKTVTSKKIKIAEKSLDTMLDKASDTMARVVRAERATPRLTKALKDLGKNSENADMAIKIIPVCINLAFAIGSFGDGIGASQTALNVANQTIGLMDAVAGELKDMAV